ncbi:MAG: hypothetical protein N2513_02330 [Deltaproteobacteria bacterium]|nr:hypothetical protein [Deltaproteobacteria bacterium]
MDKELIQRYLASEKKERIKILESLEKEKTYETVSLLSALYEAEKDKEVLKLIRRIMFYFRTAGLKVELPKEKGLSVLRRTEKKFSAKSYISNYDQDLNRVVFIETSVKKDLLFLTQAFINLQEGLLELRMGEARKEEYSSWFKEKIKMWVNLQMLFSEVSPEYAYYLIEEGSSKSKKFKDEISNLKTLIVRLDSKEKIRKPEDIYSLYDRGTLEDMPIDQILNHRIFKNFFMKWEKIKKDVLEYEKIGEGTIVLPEYLKREKRMEYLRILAKRPDLEYLSKDLKRVLEDYAYMLSSSGEHNYAKAIVNVLRKPEIFEDIFIFLLEKSILHNSCQEESPRLLVTPQEYFQSAYGKISPKG